MGYLNYVGGSWSKPSCWDFKLVFYCNMTMGVAYGFVSLLLLIPGVDKMFYSLYWDPDTFPTHSTALTNVMQPTVPAVCSRTGPSSRGTRTRDLAKTRPGLVAPRIKTAEVRQICLIMIRTMSSSK